MAKRGSQNCDIKKTATYAKQGRKTKGQRSTWNEKSSGKTEDVTKQRYNDVAWYAKNQQMLQDAASFSYNSPLGSYLGYIDKFESTNIANVDYVNNGADQRGTAVPGVMSLEIGPGVGVSTDSQSPANIAATNIYSYVRYMNSGAKNYDAPDLMMYLLSMNGIYSYWNFLKRLYGIAMTYSQLNWYMPKTYFSACRVDFEDIYSNLADFREYLNRSAAKISAFCVPAVMPLFVRQSWLYSNIYKDSDNQKAQSYIFVPSYFYKYDETTSPKGGQLTTVNWCNGNDANDSSGYAKLKDIINLMETLLSAVQYSEDIGVMSGDILKAYGSDKLFKLTAVDPNYSVEPVYNEEVLNQIHNATVMGAVIREGAAPESWNITQDPDTNYIIWNPKVNRTQLTRNAAVLNMPWDVVTPANTMVGSRLTVCATVDSADSSYQKFTAVGTEVVMKAYIWTNKYNMRTSKFSMTEATEVSSMLLLGSPVMTSTWESVSQAVRNAMYRCALLSNFDWHPIVAMFVVNESSVSNMKLYECVGMLGDFTNYTTVTSETLNRMHLTAIMSEFNIPQLGAF